MTVRAASVALLMAVIGLTACDSVVPVTPVPRPPARPEAPTAAAKPPAHAVQSEQSRTLEKYYARVQDGLLAQGLLRRDPGSTDAPFGQRQLVENFVKIALYEEYASVGGRLVARPTASRLHRWEKPVTMDLEFGATVSDAKRKRDRAALTGYAARLSRITGLPIRQVSSRGNFTVLIVNEDERRALAPRLRQLIPGLDDLAVRTVVDMPQSSYCLVFALDGNDSGVYSRAVAVIRAEHPDLLRMSCIHEEIAQGLGLSNDSPAARPSIFNDDEEFALLTNHDELLLRMLYDKRMRPGMSVAEARPIAETIAAELLGGES